MEPREAGNRHGVLQSSDVSCVIRIANDLGPISLHKKMSGYFVSREKILLRHPLRHLHRFFFCRNLSLVSRIFNRL